MTEPTDRDAEQKWNDLITRALAPPVDRALPSGFAAMVAARAEAATQATIDRRERVIQAALFACLALTALAGFGPDLLALLDHITAGTTDGRSAVMQWSAAIAVCLAVTLVVDLWMRERHAARHGVAPRSV